MKQFAWPSNVVSNSLPARKRWMFPVSTSPSKCVTEPAFDVGTFVASPIANTFGFATDWSVRRSVGTNPRSSPRPGERSTKAAPPWRGIVTRRSNGISRSS